jgi:hypothetical protein
MMIDFLWGHKVQYGFVTIVYYGITVGDLFIGVAKSYKRDSHQPKSSLRYA